MTADRPPALLVADDSKDIRTVVRITVSSLGCKVVEADRPDKALKIARSFQLDAVLQDLAFGGEEAAGFRLLKTLKSDPRTSYHQRVCKRQGG